MPATRQQTEHSDAVHNVALAHMRRKRASGYRWWLLGCGVLAAMAALWCLCS